MNQKMKERNLNTVIDVPYILSSDLSDCPNTVKIVTVKAEKAVRKSPVSVFASFCPFCGEKYKKDKPEELGGDA
jgi:hypothetical protein